MSDFIVVIIIIAIVILFYFLLNRKSRSRAIPESVKKQVREKYNDQCAICTEKNFLQYHHRKQFSEGGEHSVDNIVLLCPKHHEMVRKSNR